VANRHRADHDPLVLKISHDRVEAAPFLAKQVRGGNPAILEQQLRRVG